MGLVMAGQMFVTVKNCKNIQLNFVAEQWTHKIGNACLVRVTSIIDELKCAHFHNNMIICLDTQ